MTGVQILQKSVKLYASSGHTDEFAHEQRSDDHKPRVITVSPVGADMCVCDRMKLE